MHRERGLIGAAFTPRGKRGELNYGAAFELIDLLCKAGIPGVALLTAAGEYPSFAFEERTRLVYLGVKRSRVPVLAGVGAEDLGTAAELAREAIAAGAAGVILPPPLVLPYPDAELREYYLQFASALGSDAEIWIEGLASPDALLQTGRFAGVVGCGMTLAPEASAIPELLVARDWARRSGDAAAEAHFGAYVDEFRTWAAEFAPLVAVKIAAEVRGIPPGSLPVPVAPERVGRLEEFRAWFRSWLPGTRKLAVRA